METEEHNEPTQTEAPTEATDEVPKPKLYTGDEVAEIVKRRFDRERDRLRKEIEAKRPATTNGENGLAGEVEKLRADLAQERTDRLFAESISGLQLSAKQRGVLRAQFDPDMPGAVVELAREIFPAPEPKSQNGHHVDPGAPNGEPRAERSDPTTWTRDDVERYAASGELRSKVEAWTRRGVNSTNPFRRRKS